MFTYDLINIPPELSNVSNTFDGIFSCVAKEVPRVQKGIINIAFIDDELMQTLNRDYRNKNSTTDVLSFHYFDDFSDVSKDQIAGEIVLSLSKITSQALEHGHSPEKETQILVLHGLLHILGFDHEKDEDYEIMWRYEEKIRMMQSIL